VSDVTVAATDGAEHAPFTAGWETVKAFATALPMGRITVTPPHLGQPLADTILLLLAYLLARLGGLHQSQYLQVRHQVL
jgi:hypothetical protein